MNVYKESDCASPCNEALRELQVIDIFFTSRHRLCYLSIYSFQLNFFLFFFFLFLIYLLIITLYRIHKCFEGFVCSYSPKNRISQQL